MENTYNKGTVATSAYPLFLQVGESHFFNISNCEYSFNNYEDHSVLTIHGGTGLKTTIPCPDFDIARDLITHIAIFSQQSGIGTVYLDPKTLKLSTLNLQSEDEEYKEEVGMSDEEQAAIDFIKRFEEIDEVEIPEDFYMEEDETIILREPITE